MLHLTDAAKECSKLQSRLILTFHRKLYISTGMVRSLINKWQRSEKDHSHHHETVEIYKMKKLTWHLNEAYQIVGPRVALHSSYQERLNSEIQLELCHQICISLNLICMPNLAV